MILLFYFLVLVASQVLAAPANSSQSQVPSFDTTRTPTDSGLSSQFILHGKSSGISLITSPQSITSTPLSNSTDTTSSQATQSNDASTITLISSPLYLMSSSLLPSSIRFTSLPSTTILITEIITTFETTTVNAMQYSTSISTVVATVTATTMLAPTPSWDNRTLWAAPPQMTDLSAFNITDFPSGQQNLRIVAEIPPKALTPTTVKFFQGPTFSPNATNSPTILQLVYPAHSVNPASKPQGGADFYATPLNLAGARNVTLEYSIFFPANFDWVKGGKLPGLFGGHKGCSGGASARDCFSTRLMWRPKGIGELYLYAPKDKQSAALCVDIGSVCDATYGFSIGRGAFNFTPGGWTHLSQNVVLNTPGRTDGGFTLVVDGQTAIKRMDVFYRDVTPLARRNTLTPRRSFISNTSATTVVAIMLGNDVLQPAEFLGLFFSTFFGGHGEEYATPKQQYTWFKDFTIIRHD